jgi:hypothetical protein
VELIPPLPTCLHGVVINYAQGQLYLLPRKNYVTIGQNVWNIEEASRRELHVISCSFKAEADKKIQYVPRRLAGALLRMRNTLMSCHISINNIFQQSLRAG